MNYYALANGIIGGICLGFGILFLFFGLRRKDNKRPYLLFALFALAYAGTLFLGIRYHTATSVEEYVRLVRWDDVPINLAFIALIWYVAEYTKVRPRIFLWGLTILFVVLAITQIIRGNLLYEEILGLDALIMPWGERLAYLEATDSIWSNLETGAWLTALFFMVYACIRQYLRGERTVALILSIGVLWFVAAIGTELLARAGIIPLFFYGEFGFLGFALALSLQMSNEVIKTEEDLAQYRVNLEGLVKERTADLEATQEKLLHQTREQATIEERGRLARDLHDEVTQTIYSATLISEALPAVWERNPDEGRRNLTKLRQLVRGALAEMRTLLFELRPEQLAMADFETLVHQLSDAFTGRTRIPVAIQVGGTGQPPSDVKTAFYRIAQEAFNNISKHADAQTVTVFLQQRPDRVILTIKDDGLGFDPGSVSGEHMGITIMRERAESIQANIDINSQSRQGASITVTWPKAGENRQ